MLARQALLPSVEPRMSISPKASVLPARITRACTSASCPDKGLRKLVFICTVVQGRKLPNWLMRASTIAVSAAAIIAWPHSISPTRESRAFCGSRSVTLSASNASTFSSSACTQGAK